MSFVSALWFLLLQALSGCSATQLHMVQCADGSVVTVEVHRPRGIAAAQANAPEEAVRASIVDARTVFVRFGSRAPGGATPAQQARPFLVAPFVVRAVPAGQSADEVTYRVSSRGSLLPYDSTAPPTPV